MRPHPSGRILGLFIGLIAVGAGHGLRAADGPSEKSLAKHGLTRAGTLLVLESETEVHAKADEVRHLSRQMGSAVAQQRATLSEKQYQDTIKELTAEINQLRAEANTVNQTMSRLPRSPAGTISPTTSSPRSIRS